jgi:hypothetical protein
MLIYVDDTIILGPKKEGIQEIITKLRSSFEIEDEGNIADYLGIKITKLPYGTITLTQPHTPNPLPLFLLTPSSDTPHDW